MTRLSRRREIIEYLTSTDNFKIVFLLSLVLAAYGCFVLGVSSQNYIDTVFITFSFPFFNICFFSILTFNTLNTCSTISNYLFNYIIRLKDKKKYLIKLLLINLLMNTLWYFLLIIMYFSFLNLYKMGTFQLHGFYNYSINNVIYCIFYLCRYYVLAMLYSFISSILFLNFKNKGSLLFAIVFQMLLLIGVYDGSYRSSISFNLSDYFSITLYSDFLIEFEGTCIYIIFIIVMVLLSAMLTLKRKKMIIS